jgi:hypothetical protein
MWFLIAPLVSSNSSCELQKIMSPLIIVEGWYFVIDNHCEKVLLNSFLSFKVQGLKHRVFHGIQKDKQKSGKHTYQTKDRVTRTPLKTVGEFRCSGTVGSSCSTSGIRRVNLVTNPVISREWGKNREVFAIFRVSGSYQDCFARGLLLTRKLRTKGSFW